MKKSLKTIVFFGTDEFSAVSLRELIAHGFHISAVVTKPDSRKGRGKELSAPLVKQIAAKHNLPVWQPLKLSEITEKIAGITKAAGGQKPMGVLVSYGKIIPQSIIEMFEPGIVNVHPSLLPKYRGPSPIEAAILHGDTETGVSIMQLTAAMDAGPVYKQVILPLNDTETAPLLAENLAELGAQQLCLTLPGIINGQVEPSQQDEASAVYCQLISKDESRPNPLDFTAEQLERRIRAYLGFPKTIINVAGHDIVATKAHISALQASPLDIKCADGRFLSIEELIGPSGKKMDARGFINGYVK